MRWSFLRAALVLALLACGVFGHGWRTPDAASAVTDASHHTIAGVDEELSSSGDDAAARDGHRPDDHSCDAAWTVDKTHSPAIPSLRRMAPPPVDDGSRGEPPIAAPASWSGRSLLLRQCVSRT